MTWLVWAVCLALVFWGLDTWSRNWKPVSGNPHPVGKTGPKWEQDAPFVECFDSNDEYREDDL